MFLLIFLYFLFILYFFLFLKDGDITITNLNVSECYSSGGDGGGFMTATGEGYITITGCNFTGITQKGNINSGGSFFF
jgi:hypothetical protein